MPLSRTGLVTTSLPSTIHFAPVSSLFSISGNTWDVDLVRDVFNTEDISQILQLPLTSRPLSDSWFWRFLNDGHYSVRSSYRLLYGEFDMSQSLPWMLIWNLQGPAKVKDFLWRLCSNCFPTKDALMAKRVSLDQMCQVCNAAAESGLHLFVSCNFA